MHRAIEKHQAVHCTLTSTAACTHAAVLPVRTCCSWRQAPQRVWAGWALRSGTPTTPRPRGQGAGCARKSPAAAQQRVQRGTAERVPHGSAVPFHGRGRGAGWQLMFPSISASKPGARDCQVTLAHVLVAAAPSQHPASTRFCRVPSHQHHGPVRRHLTHQLSHLHHCGLRALH